MDLFLIVLSGVFIGSNYLFTKKIADSRYHPLTFVILFQIINALVVSSVFLFRFRVPSSLYYWVLLFVSAGLFSLGTVFGYKSYQTTQASVVGLVNRLNLVITAFLGIFLLSEKYGPGSYLGLLLIFIGSSLIIYEGRGLHFTRGIIFSILMAFCYSLTAVLDKYLLFQFSPFTYALLSNTASLIIMLSIYRSGRELAPFFREKYRFLIPAGILNGIGWLLLLIAFARGAVSRVFPIQESTALLVTVIFGILLLRERTQLPQKLFGCLMVILGIFLLY